MPNADRRMLGVLQFSSYMTRHIFAIFVLAASAFAATERGITIKETTVYISPDTKSEKLATLDRGREIAVLEPTNNGWLHVLASITGQRDVTGWVRDRGIVRAVTPNGDRVMYGEAVDSEAEASKRGGRKGADRDAMRLYAAVQEYFPQSPLAGEALYRAADIRWQLSAPTMKRRDPNLRGISEEEDVAENAMKQVIKKFPHTKWSDLAEFHLLDLKLCPDWQGESKCPEKEAAAFEKYAEEHPQAPNAPEALYNAAWRRAALIQIYRTENKNGQINDAKTRATNLAQRVVSQYAQNTDWSARAQALLFKLQQDIPVYGNAE
jgi:outer membrane protein assembly factor BamD (BamD/ComL family)